VVAAAPPGLPVIARVRPANVASARVAERAGLVRAEHLDTDGADGPDLIFQTPQSAAGSLSPG
jgi:RimJ/RimL family protein N-acetyltransferase